MRALLPVLLAFGLAAAEPPKLFFSKLFPKSSPEYVAITVDKDGRGSYKEAEDDDSPLLFLLRPNEVAEIFSLAEKLDRFQRPLESGLNVAKTGVKTFRYLSGAGKTEVQFNYSQDLDAQTLLDWFERISETERRYATLERAAKYDKLGVNQALLQLQAEYDRNRVVAADQFLPLLDRIAKNENYMHIARARAAGLAEAIRGPKPESQ